MKSHRSLLTLIACTMISDTLTAQEEEATPLTTEVELGAVNTSGNTDARASFPGRGGLGREQWEYGLLIDGLRSSHKRNSGAQRFTTSATNYQLDENSFIQSRLLTRMIVSTAMTANQILRSVMAEACWGRPNMSLTSKGIGYRISFTRNVSPKI